MKSVAVILFLAGVLFFVKGQTPPEFQENFKPILESCQEKITYTEQDLDDVLNLRENLTQDGKCLLACAKNELGFVKCGQFGEYEDIIEGFNTLFAGNQVALDHGEEYVNVCIVKAKKESPFNLCEAAFIALKCFHGLLAESVYSETIYEKTFGKLARDCQQELGGTDQDVQDVIDLKVGLTAKGMCITACADERYGYIEDGKYVANEKSEKLMRDLMEDQEDFLPYVEKSVQKCFPEANENSDGDICKAADIIIECIDAIIKK